MEKEEAPPKPIKIITISEMFNAILPFGFFGYGST